jgi:hypothetical protein
MWGSGGGHYQFPTVTGLGTSSKLDLNFLTRKIVTEGVCPSLGSYGGQFRP